MINPALGIKLVYILGITNLIGLALVLLSCRCTLGLNSDKFSNSKFYMAIYKYHCYYWWLFIASVIAHAIIAFISFGNPFTG
jgi:hypothetical protein